MTDSYKRLLRSTTNRKVAGVCGGLAKYLNIDPTVVRIAYFIAVACGGLGIGIYLIMWLLMPEDNQLTR